MELLDANKLYKISLFVLFLYFVKVASCAQKIWKRNKDFDGKVSPDGSTISVRSRIHCGKTCLDDGVCVSFFYLPGFLCQLHDHVIISVDGLRDLEKSTYYVLYEGEPVVTTPPVTTTPPFTMAPAPPPTTTIPTFTCPPDDSIYRTILLSDGNPFTYKVVKTEVDQFSARTACSDEGAYLARVKTVAKLNMLLDLIHNCPGYLGTTDYYVDGSNAYFNSDQDVPPWKFIDGSFVPMSNDFWGSTYPNNPFDEHCLRMRAEVDFKWDDCYCSRNCYFICEK